MKSFSLGLCALLFVAGSVGVAEERDFDRTAAELKRICLEAHLWAIDHDMARLREVFGWMLSTDMAGPIEELLRSMAREREKLSTKDVAGYSLPGQQVLVGRVTQAALGGKIEFAGPHSKSRVGYLAAVRGGLASLKPNAEYKMVVYWLWSSRTDEAIAESHLEENPPRGHYVYVDKLEQLGPGR